MKCNLSSTNSWNCVSLFLARDFCLLQLPEESICDDMMYRGEDVREGEKGGLFWSSKMEFLITDREDSMDKHLVFIP